MESTTELIRVVQLPVITEKLELIKKQIESAVEYVLSLDCNENTYKEIKKLKAELNKQYQELDDKRKEAKKAVLAPYNEFEAVFNKYVRDVFKPAERQISERISSVENSLKATKQKEVEEYFGEYAKSIGIDFVAFEQLRLNITMSASLKSLKKQVKEFLDNVIQNLALIATQPHSPEILIEYRKSLNASQSILMVQERYKVLEELEAKKAESEAEATRQTEAIKKVDEAIQEFSAPRTEEAEPEENEPIYEATFTVRGTMGQLKELKSFLKEGGYDYE